MAGSLQVKMLEGLAAQQARVDKAIGRLTEVRSGTSHKKFSAAQKEVIGKVKEAEAKVNAASAANAALVASAEKPAEGKGADPLKSFFKMKTDLVAARKAQVNAELAISGARQFIRDQQRDLRSKGGAEGVLAEFQKLLEQLTALQAALDKEKTSLSELKPAKKPFYMCEAEAPYFKACDSSGDEHCRLKPGEVLLMIEDPSPEPVVEIERARGRCSNDGRIGWVTLKDFKEQDKTDKFLVCSAATAMTNVFDIVESKAVRKIEVGEVLVQLEEPKEDAGRSLIRVRVKAKRDGLEGWATVRGNQGTTFVSETTSHRECRCATALHTTLSSDSKVLRMLDEGEIFDVRDRPKTEKREGSLLAKGRNISNGVEGWFASTGSSFVKWSPVYSCVRSTDLKDGVEDTAKVLRALEVGESLCALRPPARSDNGVFHLQVQAEKDGVVGFANINEEGAKAGRFSVPKTFLRPVFREA